VATWGDFANALCAALGAPTSTDNIDALLAWFLGEQPPDQPNAAFNPLNIQAGDFAHNGTSGSGQYNFASFADGVVQTAAFLQQGFYTGIVAALVGNAGCVAVLTAVEQSPWAEGHYGYQLHNSCATIEADRARYLAGQISGTGGPSGPPSGGGGGGSGPQPPGGINCVAPFTL